MSDDLRTELIQVAAVAVAFVEHLDRGFTDYGEATRGILAEVLVERRRQDVLYGSRVKPSWYWLTVLMREVGEVAQAMPEVEQIREEQRG